MVSSPKLDKDNFLKLIESLPDPYLILDQDLVIQCASDAYIAGALTKREMIIGKHVFEIFPNNPELSCADGTENLHSSLQRVLQSGKPHKGTLQRYVVRNPDHDGFEEKHWSCSNTPVLDEDGSVRYIIHKIEGVNKQVENHRQVKERPVKPQDLLSREEKVQQARELQRTLLLNTFMQAPVAIGIFKGPDHVVELLNESMCQFWRTSADMMEGKPLFKAMPELVKQGTKERLDYVLRTGETYVGKKIAIQLQGRNGTVYFNVVNQPMTDLHGHTIGVIAMAVEVTEEINALQEAENSKNRFRDLANAIPHIVWTADENGLIEYINERWDHYTGLSREESQGWGWIKAVFPGQQENTKDKWQKALQGEDKFVTEYKLRRADGSYRWHRINAIAVKENGMVTKWYGTSTDIHDQKQTLEHLEKVSHELTIKNEALHRVNRDLDTFVFTASHDLRSPVINLESLFKLLLESFGKGEDTANLEKMINYSFDRFKNTLRDLAEIIKVDKEDPLDAKAVSFAEMLDETRFNIEGAIQESGAKIRSDFQVPEIRFSRKNLRSLFYNFISNSIKYRHPGRKPQVFVRTSKVAEDELLLTISDNGFGMDAEKQTKIFGMFTRLHKHVEGSGIGLYIVKRMIDNAGGRIEVESQLNEGTTFKIYLKQ